MIDNVVKFQDLILISFSATYLSNRTTQCASTSITLFWLIVVCLQLFPLQFTTQSRSIPSLFDSAVGCCVDMSPPTSHRPSISNWSWWCVDPYPPLSPCQLLRCSSPHPSATANELIVMYSGCSCCSSSCIHLNAHHLCTSQQRCTDLCTAIRPFQWFWWLNQPTQDDRRQW